MKIERVLKTARSITDEGVIKFYDESKCKVTTDEDLDDIEWAVVINQDGQFESLVVKTNTGKVYTYEIEVDADYNPVVRKIEFIGDKYLFYDKASISEVYKVNKDDLYITHTACLDALGWAVKHALIFDPSPELIANRRLEKELGLKENNGRYYISDVFYIIANETYVDPENNIAYYVTVRQHKDAAGRKTHRGVYQMTLDGMIYYVNSRIKYVHLERRTNE